MTDKIYRHIIFDLDGTLVNTAPDIALCINQLLEKRSIPVLSDKVISRFIGKGTELFIQNLYSFLSIRLTDWELTREIELFTQLYKRHPVQKSSLYDQNTYAVMKSLTEQGMKIGICTNKIESITLTILKHFRLIDFCSTIICGDTLPIKKPNPLPLLTAMKQIHADNSNTLYIGDTRTDLQCCQAANVDFMAVQWGMDETVSLLPIHFLRNMQELLTINSNGPFMDC